MCDFCLTHFLFGFKKKLKRNELKTLWKMKINLHTKKKIYRSFRKKGNLFYKNYKIQFVKNHDFFRIKIWQ